MSAHDDFAESLMQEAAVCPSGLTTWNGSDPSQRFAVYRNNVIVSLIDALADTFPVTQALVGEAFFRAMAGQFVRAHPPRSPVLTLYGDLFPSYVCDFAPASALPYLGDLARLEVGYVQTYHAAEEGSLAISELSKLLSNEMPLSQVRFTLHPSINVVRSRYAVVSLWAAHQDLSPENTLGSIHPDVSEAAMLIRQDLDVVVVRIEHGAALFIENLHRGAVFADAVSTDVPFNLETTLALMLRYGAIIRYNI